MRVLVTGASGMLGAGVAARAGRRGDDVTVLQRRPAGLAASREVLGDVADRDAVARRPWPGRTRSCTWPPRSTSSGPGRSTSAANVERHPRPCSTRCRAAGVGRLVHVSSPSVAHAGPSLVGAGAGPADPERARGHYAADARRPPSCSRWPPTTAGLAVVAVRPHLVWGPGDTQLVERIVDRARAGPAAADRLPAPR